MAGIPSKSERLDEFFRRLDEAAPSETFQDAYDLLRNTLDQIEDELTGLPNEPDQWMNSDRLYPPQPDRMSKVAECDVNRFDNVRHITYIAANGSIEIRRKPSPTQQIQVEYSKPGADGRHVSEVCPGLSNANR